MITRLSAPGRERIYDGEVGRFVEASAIPCHRCGICCERWQPLVDESEIARLARFLGIDAAAVREVYTQEYPFDDSARLLRRQEGACVFLRREPDGRSLCSVHPARPEICRSWTASLDRRECVDGLGRFAAPAALIAIAAIYDQVPDRVAFECAVRGDGAVDAN